MCATILQSGRYKLPDASENDIARCLLVPILSRAAFVARPRHFVPCRMDNAEHYGSTCREKSMHPIPRASYNVGQLDSQERCEQGDHEHGEDRKTRCKILSNNSRVFLP